MEAGMTEMNRRVDGGAVQNYLVYRSSGIWSLLTGQALDHGQPIPTKPLMHPLVRHWQKKQTAWKEPRTYKKLGD